MIRKLVVSLGLLAACGLAVGCGGSSGAGGTKPSGDKGSIDKLKEGATVAGDKIASGAKEAAAKTKEAVIKPMVDMYPKIEEKIKGMKGDAAKTASEKFEAFKKMVDDFKTSDKWESMKDGLMTKFAELKKAVGL
ncbi:MAG TPA: hypothetical protein VGJ05_16390 [Fimbriiglobus sp.]|jgi:hypothetical protein